MFSFQHTDRNPNPRQRSLETTTETLQVLLINHDPDGVPVTSCCFVLFGLQVPLCQGGDNPLVQGRVSFQD